MRKELGKIASVKMGFIGYQDCEFGLSLTLSGKSWGVCTQLSGGWFKEPGEHTKWTVEDQRNNFANVAYKIIELLKTAKVEDVEDLVGKPIEAQFDGMKLNDWRILEEVI